MAWSGGAGVRQLISWLGKGVLAVGPALITAYALFWLFTTLEGLLGGLLLSVVGERLYVPGTGLILALALLIGVGMLIDAYVGQWFVDRIDALANRVPVVKSIYGAVRDLLQFAIPGGGGEKEELRRVVAWECKPGVWLVGFVTGVAFVEVGDPSVEKLSVYFPMSYQIGGYTFLLSETDLTTVNMSVEDAMKGILTAGVMGRTDGR